MGIALVGHQLQSRTGERVAGEEEKVSMLFVGLAVWVVEKDVAVCVLIVC